VEPVCDRRPNPNGLPRHHTTGQKKAGSGDSDLQILSPQANFSFRRLPETAGRRTFGFRRPPETALETV